MLYTMLLCIVFVTIVTLLEGTLALEETPGKVRVRRNSIEREINLDVVILVGYSVYESFYERSAGSSDAVKRSETIDAIQEHFALMYNSVERRFKSANTNYNINLVGFEMIEEGRHSPWVLPSVKENGGQYVLDGHLMLSNIWNWTLNEDNLPQHDVIVAYETWGLYSFEENEYLPDFSYQSSICVDEGKPLVLIRFGSRIAKDVLQTTHGLGHALGALDDGTSNNCSSDDHYAMASDYTKTLDSGNFNPYYFSNCSKQYFEDHVTYLLSNSSESRSCLLDAMTPVNVTNMTGILPGEVYDPDAQCRLMYGAQSYHCHTASDYNICDRMDCYHPGDAECYFTYGAEGTTCGNKRWCMSGDCVYSVDAPTADEECVHGDQEGVGGGGCASLIPSVPYYCYYSNIKRICCHSCQQTRGDDEGCQYGDDTYAEPNCQYNNCNSSDTYMYENCCETCSDLRTTTTSPSTMTDTTTSPSTMTETTTPTSTMTEITTSPSTMDETTTPTSTMSETTTSPSTMDETTTPTSTMTDTTTSPSTMTETTTPTSTMTDTTTSPSTMDETTTPTSTMSETTTPTSTMSETTTPTSTMSETTTPTSTMSETTTPTSTMTDTTTPTSTMTDTTTPTSTMTDTTTPTSTMTDRATPKSTTTKSITSDTATLVSFMTDTTTSKSTTTDINPKSDRPTTISTTSTPTTTDTTMPGFSTSSFHVSAASSTRQTPTSTTTATTMTSNMAALSSPSSRPGTVSEDVTDTDSSTIAANTRSLPPSTTFPYSTSNTERYPEITTVAETGGSPNAVTSNLTESAKIGIGVGTVAGVVGLALCCLLIYKLTCTKTVGTNRIHPS